MDFTHITMFYTNFPFYDTWTTDRNGLASFEEDFPYSECQYVLLC